MTAIQFVLGYIWLVAGLEKVWSADFVNNFSKTLQFFASKNPLTWYVQLVNSWILLNPTLWARLIQWSEVGVGLVLMLGCSGLLYNVWQKNKYWRGLLALAWLASALMNLNFYFAAGWTGPSSAGLNMLMFWVEMIFIYGLLTEL